MTKGNTTADEISEVDEGASSEQSRARTRLRTFIQQRGITPLLLTNFVRWVISGRKTKA